MKLSFSTMILGAPVALLSAVPAFANQAVRRNKQEKVDLCHVPPGSPSNFHTISVAKAALASKVHDSDMTGACDEFCDVLCYDLLGGWDKCHHYSSTTCEADGCRAEAIQPNSCDDGRDCSIDTCNPIDGTCQHDTSGCTVQITEPGVAYGHHGSCSNAWNKCNSAQECALAACKANGYNELVSFGEAKPCRQFNMCHLFYHIDSDVCNVDYNWGNWCDVNGVTDIVCVDEGGPCVA